MLGLEVEQVAAEVARAGHQPRPGRVARARRRSLRTCGTGGVDEVGEPTPGEAARAMPVPDRRDPVVLAERQLLQVLLQFPTVLRRAPSTCCPPTPSRRRPTARSSTGSGSRTAPVTVPLGTWVSAVTEAAPRPSRAHQELAVATLPTRMDPMTGLPTSRYVEELFDRVRTVSSLDGWLTP